MLTLAQQEAVKYTASPLVIIAGPGGGKTSVITQKIGFLFEKFSPEAILALTFTQKAAEEMSNRVEKDFNTTFNAKTFHSFGLELLEEFGVSLNILPEKYTLLDESLQLLFFSENLNKFKINSIDIKDKLSTAKECMSCVSKLKDFGYSLNLLETLEMNIHTKIDIFSFYSKYESYKKENNYLDFGDILLYTKNLLENEKILLKIKEKYSYILVDEFQDTNKIQLEILLKISNSTNITIVGDKKQSIYGFRGSNYSNFDLFEKSKKNVKTHYLSDNFRSSKKVIDQINKLTKKISSDKEVLSSQIQIEGGVELIESKNEFCELGFIIESLQDLKKSGKTIGVLTRRKSELKQISDALKLINIPHTASGLYSFKDSNLVSYVIKMLHFLENPKEESVVLFSFLEDLSVASETLRTLSRKSSLNEKSLYVVLKNSKIYSEKKEEQEILFNFVNNLSKLLELKSSKLSLPNYILKIISTFNLYQKALNHQNSFEVESLNSFLNYLSKIFQDAHINEISKLLKILKLNINISSSDEIEKNNHKIELLTVHNSKGKEFDIVFLPFLNDKKFPTSFRKNLFETNIDMEKKSFEDEEKKLFFVAISRAKEKLYLSYVKKYSQNKLDAKRSYFLNDLDISPKKYEREFYSNIMQINPKEEKILKEINGNLLDKNFSKAKQLVEYMSSLHSKKPNLHSYIHNSNTIDKHSTMQDLDSNGDNIVIDPKKMVYSVSQLKTYEQCPKKYMYQYIYKIPTPSKHYFDFGTSLHSVLEEIQPLSKKLSEKELHLKGLGELSKQWISKSYESADQEKQYYEKGIQIIRSFVKKEKLLFKDSKTLSLEKEFWLTIEGKRIMGYIDRIEEIDGTIQILDYKTSNSQEPKSKLKENLQLYVYALAMSKDGIIPKSMGLWYLLHDTIDTIEFDKSIAEKIKKYILMIIAEIEKGIFLSKPNHFNCTYCDFNSICTSSYLK